jgi:hypothetical protein
MSAEPAWLQLRCRMRSAKTPAMPFRAPILALLCFALPGCASRLNVSAPQRVDYAGHWTLNEKLSMDPEAVVRDQQRPGRDRREAPPPTDPNRVGGVLDNSPSRPPEAGVRGGSAYGKLWERAIRDKIAMLSPGASLEISQSATEMSILSGDASARYVYGDKVIISVPDGVAERIAGWDGNRFIVRTSSPDGVRSERVFELASGGRQLVVTTEVIGEGPATVVRLVYDRVSA